MAEYFGTQPSDAELPETLPAGTRACYALGDGHRSEPGLTAFTELRLVPPYYVGGWHHDDGKLGNSSPTASVTPRAIHWASVRKQPPLPTANPMPEGVAFKVGDRVEWDDKGLFGGGPADYVRPHAGGGHIVKIHGDEHWFAGTPLRHAARLLASEPTAAERAAGDLLHETGCCLCGEASGLCQRYSGPHARSLWCDPCRERFMIRPTDPGNEGIDAEITRRKSLRPATAPAAPPPSTPAGKADPDPYEAHRRREEYEEQNPRTFAASHRPCPHCAGPFSVALQTCTTCGLTDKALHAGAQPTDLDRLASRRSKIGQLLGELGDGKSRRESVKRHPSTWPEAAYEDAPDGEPRVS